jgi:UDP-GlcNAc:undecaprenyl-phosphate GlcNAc-1-phosphate transferase
VIALALAGAIIGFWRYNRYPAKIIMGDSGALFLGFVIAAVSVHGLMKTTTMVAVAVPIVALGLPITDTVFAIARRLRQGKPIMQADRGHLHHRLLDEFGLPQTRAVLILHFVSACFGLAALALEAYQVWLALGVLAALALGARLSLSKAAPADNQRRQTGISDR